MSFTLFGKDEMYQVGAIRNAEIWRQSEFDVDTIFYVGSSVPDATLTRLNDLGAKIEFIDGPEDQTATFWRYGALALDYDYMLFRDVDSRPFEREFAAIREWLPERFDFHVIRDHPFHGVPILAGLFGVKRDLIGVVRDRLPMEIPEDFYKTVVRACNHVQVNYSSNDFYQVDQWWLRLNVYPVLRNKIMAHDEFFGFERHRWRRILPDRPEDNAFCGEGFNELDEPRFPDHRAHIDTWPKRSLIR